MTPHLGRTWAAWLFPLVFVFAGCGDSDPLAVGPDPDGDSVDVDTIAPAVPSEVRLWALYNRLEVTWAPNTEPDLAGYVVERSLDSGETWTLMTGTPLAGTTYLDDVYRLVQYRVAAVDVSANQSAFSGAVGYRAPNDRPKFTTSTHQPQ